MRYTNGKGCHRIVAVLAAPHKQDNPSSLTLWYPIRFPDPALGTPPHRVRSDSRRVVKHQDLMNELGSQPRWVNPHWTRSTMQQAIYIFVHAYSRYLLGTSLCARCRLPCHAHLWKTFSYLHFILCMLIVIAYRHYKLHQSLFDRHTTEGKRVRA